MTRVDSRLVRPSRWWYAFAAATALAGLLSAATWLALNATAFSGPQPRFLAQASVGRTVTVVLQAEQSYVLYADQSGADVTCAFSENVDDDDFSPMTHHFANLDGRHFWRSAYEIQALETRRYRITCVHDEYRVTVGVGNGSFAVGEPPPGHGNGARLFWVLGMLPPGVLTGGIVTLVTATRRREHRQQLRMRKGLP